MIGASGGAMASVAWDAWAAWLGVLSPTVLEEIILGVYLGLLTGIVPALVSFALGFGFKYLTNVTVPGLGVVVLAGAIAGISGGLLGVMSPDIAGSWTGIIAVVVILMASLWAHAVGDALGAKTPRTLTIQRIRESRLSADLVDRVDTFGQIRVHPVGDVHDIEGYPPLPDDVHEAIRRKSWRFPATQSLPEIEAELSSLLMDEFDLAEVSLQVDRRGGAQIAAAPSTAGLSRRLPRGTRAVTIDTLLPTGMAREDVVTVGLPDGTVTGPVVSARTDPGEDGREAPLPVDRGVAPDDGVDDAEGETPAAPRPKAPTTTGGSGKVTLAVSPDEARRVIDHDFAPVIVHARGKQREYEAIALLTAHGNRFRKLGVADGSAVAGRTIADARLEDEYGVAVLTLHRGPEVHVAPGGGTELQPGDQLIVTGSRDALRRFREVAG